MGLTITHGAFSGSYGSFNRLRQAVAASGGKAAAAKLTTEERRARAMRGWERRREKLATAIPGK